ncbi:MAG TPA: pyridoxamine 5'-phosphate oxidase, partial [Actinomycetota bacterium]|nr:pyridoxamine 5'-phosphate oxidase [Actinomycetota bacterium]
IAELRATHPPEGLEIEDLDPDPLIQFARWLEAALSAQPDWPNSMTLATADVEGRPSSRTVLLKGVDERGFVFFTNKDSRKGRELRANPFAATTFYWPVLERQVCVRGPVEEVGEEESDRYFETRPLGSRLGAWASPQSTVIESRAVLESAVAELSKRFGSRVPRPPHWGGFRLVPDALEFWKGRNDRLHDRFLYERSATGWTLVRLAP